MDFCANSSNRKITCEDKNMSEINRQKLYSGFLSSEWHIGHISDYS